MLTSNYARQKRIPEGMTPIAISRRPPRWYKGPVELDLAPTSEMLKMDRTGYDEHFQQLLKRLDPREMYARLGENAVLLCFEAPNVGCHRRLVAEWFESELGIVVCEMGFARDEIFAYSQMPWK